MEICSYKKCTGCFACVSACPRGCITMNEDKYGELHPFIENAKCVRCGACQKACPNNNNLVYNYPKLCYASWITDEKKRRICASGGIGTIMSEYIIRVRDGVLFGSRYDDDFTPIMTYTDDISELEKYKGSRYVQSIVGSHTFNEVKYFLENNRSVLFIGTPCQIAGLKCFLKKDYESLITVDLICHGCCPTRYFKDEVKEICSSKGIKELFDIRFRGNDGNNYSFTFWGKKKVASNQKPKLLYKRNGYESYYLGGFLLGVNLRENCYTCTYARPERVSDITIGDFIGLGKEIPFDYSTDNVSSVTINTEKGMKFYHMVSKYAPELMNIERAYEERLKYQASLMKPFERHPLTDKFRSFYIDSGYIVASRKVLNRIIITHRIHRVINNVKRCLTFSFYSTK